MTIAYKPGNGIIINGKEINWREDRQNVRSKIGFNYKSDDRVIDLSEYNDGDPSKNIDVKRDIYGSTEGLYYFFLNYNVDHTLESIEVHSGPAVMVEGESLSFEEDIHAIVQKLDRLDETRQELSAGEQFYKSLKIVVASNDAMGGDGDGLSYFYAADKIDHLLEDLG